MNFNVGDIIHFPIPDNPEDWHSDWKQYFGKVGIVVEHLASEEYYCDINIYWLEKMKYGEVFSVWLKKYDL